MPSLTKQKTQGKQRYHCVNPNCKRVFARPKIIKYYVCPTCQTLIDAVEEETQEFPQLEHHPGTQTRKRTRAEAQPQPITMRDVKTENQTSSQEKLGSPEQKPETDKPFPAPEQNQTLQLATAAEIPSESQQQPVILEQTITPPPSSSGCQYGFGYLSQREKGQGIPDTCIECPKSLSCMLSEYYKKEEIKEIKKWYSF